MCPLKRGKITELKTLERTRLEAIQQTQEQQHRIEEAKVCRQRQQQRIDTLCHELRNPLQGVFDNIALLSHHLNMLVAFCQSERQTGLKKTALLKQLTEMKESLQAMDTCAHHQQVIVEDMLSLLKIETQQVVLQDVVFNPKQVVKNVIKIVHSDICKKSLYLVETVPTHSFLVKGDPGRLMQVLLNLLTNALKFTSPGGALTVSLKYTSLDQQGRPVELQFAIKDTGIGMTPVELSRIFDRFAQGSHKTYQEYGDSGLSLAISKGLVELMGGRIHVVSRKNQGSTFSFNIPCALVRRMEPPKAPSPLSGAADAMESPILTGQSILVVENNLINQIRSIGEGKRVTLKKSLSIKRDSQDNLRTGVIPFCLLPVGMPLFVLSRGELCTKIFLKTEKNQTCPHKKRSRNFMQKDQQNVRKKRKTANLNSVSPALFALKPNTKSFPQYLPMGFSSH